MAAAVYSRRRKTPCWRDRFAIEPGEVAERFKAAVLKTAERKLRGFESLPLRRQDLFSCPARRLGITRHTGLQSKNDTWGGAREVEWGRLLSGCGVYSSTEGSNPSLPAVEMPFETCISVSRELQFFVVRPFGQQPMCP